MRFFLLLFVATVIVSCTSSKNPNRANHSLSLDDIELGKDQTAVTGTVRNHATVGSKIFATIAVISMKQGGANSVAYVPGSEVNVVFTPAFQKKFSDENGFTVDSQLEEGQEILVSLSRNLKTAENRVNFFKVK